MLSPKIRQQGVLQVCRWNRSMKENKIIMNEGIKNLIDAADKAIKEERFDDLMEYYTEDAVLVVKPGLEVKGKESIQKAFIKIAAYFKNSVVPTQGKMMMIETGDTVLVLSQTVLQSDNQRESVYSMERRATYVYRNMNGKWLCAIDNSYGTALLD
jgi:Ketosteroid isomerase homolog